MKKRITFLLVTALMCGAASATVLNEWTFEADLAGLTLSMAANSGTDIAAFSADTVPVTQTDGLRGLICNNDVGGVGNLWTDGAILQADVTDLPSGVRFLRYDLDYDLTATNSNNSGTLLGLSFSDATGTKLAGVALQCLTYSGAMPPAGVTETVFESGLELSGSLAVIAKVDLDAVPAPTLEVWYNFSGDNSFNASNLPNAIITNLNLTAIEELEFRATGDLIASVSNASVVVDNIRTASTWAEIIVPPADLQSPPELVVSISGDDGMAVGQTNLISVTINNSGGRASGVTSTLAHNGGGALSIVSSSNPVGTLTAGASTIHTYEVVANATASGPYILTAQATSVETASAPATFDFIVGSRISFAPPPALTDDPAFVFPDEVEPGETFELTIASVNDGGLTVNNITNSLTAVNSAYFPSITPMPVNGNIYPSMAVGATNTTTYQVTCSANTPDGLQTFTVVNRTADKLWPGQFQLNVRREAIVEASTNTLTITVVAGDSISGSVILSNLGNDGASFSVTDDGRRPSEEYTVEPLLYVQRELFHHPDFHPDTVFADWNGDTSVPKEIGFEFSLFGQQCSFFSASQDGSLILIQTNVVAGVTNIVTATLMPFGPASSMDQSKIRYKRTGTGLVVTWGNGSQFDNELERQVWLNTDGTVQYLYEYGLWSAGSITLESVRRYYDNEGEVSTTVTSSQIIDYTPGTIGMGGLLLTSDPWVTYRPTEGTVSAQGSQLLTFTASPEFATDTDTYEFSAIVTGGGTSSTIDVSVVVVSTGSANPGVDIIPTPLEFSGPAGSLSSPASVTLTNWGNVTMDFTIVEDVTGSSGYYRAESVEYDGQWRHIPVVEDYILDPTMLSNPVPIGFPFTFFGKVNTNLIVGIDGTLTLADGHQMIVFSDGLTMDSESSIRALMSGDSNEFIVTWEKMVQADGARQTFQAVLFRDEGLIRCHYQQLSGTWADGTVELFNKINGTATVEGPLLNEDTSDTTTTVTEITTFVTNWIGNTPFVWETVEGYETNVVVTPHDTANLQAMLYTPQKKIMSVSPASGAIAPGETVEITFRGDARSLTAGGGNDVTNSTFFDFYFETQNPYTQTLVNGSDAFEWEPSGRSTEYYLVSTNLTDRNPYLLEPDTVLYKPGRPNTAYQTMTRQSIDSAPATGNWTWGDVNTNGFDTLYLQFPGDPDTMDNNDVIKTPDSLTHRLPVTFIATGSVETAYPSPAVQTAMWGTENPVVSVEQNEVGSRTLSWPAVEATDDYWSRTYVVQYTTSLSEPWVDIVSLKNITTYVDDDPARNAAPVIFYRVTVQ